jgi:hypothetical protein
VIQIDSIYSTRSAGSNIKIVSIVMNVAKHGSILKIMKSKTEEFSESQIRIVME